MSPRAQLDLGASVKERRNERLHWLNAWVVELKDVTVVKVTTSMRAIT